MIRPGGGGPLCLLYGDTLRGEAAEAIHETQDTQERSCATKERTVWARAMSTFVSGCSRAKLKLDDTTTVSRCIIWATNTPMEM